MQLLFGIRATGPLNLTVTAAGDLPAQPPELRIKTAGQEIPIPYSGGMWSTTVAAGDSIIYMPVHGSGCFFGPVSFTLSASATIITVPSGSESPISWTATSGATVGPRTVKDPWPPALSAQVAPLANPGWIGGALGAMATQVANLRSSPSPSQAPESLPSRRDNYR